MIGDVGFDERELLRDAQFDDSYYKSPGRPDISMQPIEDKTDTMLAETSTEQAMDVDLPPQMMGEDFGGGGFIGEICAMTFVCMHSLFHFSLAC